MLIISDHIISEKGEIAGGILIKNGKISKIFTDQEEISQSKEKVIDMTDQYVIPGIIDNHIHGGGGWRIEGGDQDSIRSFAGFAASQGITACLPTTGTGTQKDILKSLQDIAAVMETGNEGAEIIGIHMEGPFLSQEKKGAFNPDHLLEPSIDKMKEYLEASHHHIRQVSLAPELSNGNKLVNYLHEEGIIASIAHSNASYEQAEASIDAGVTLSTHTCNAQSGIHHRKPGTLGAVLMDDRVNCELIADFFHVHPQIVSMILKLKGYDRVNLISDSIELAGLPSGKYQMFGHISYIDPEGWCVLPNRTISGSTRPIILDMKNLVEKLKVPLEQVVKMSSTNPAKVAGVFQTKGSIAEGKDADLVVLNHELQVQKTLVRGKLVFDSERDSDYLNSEAISLYRVGEYSEISLDENPF